MKINLAIWPTDAVLSTDQALRDRGRRVRYQDKITRLRTDAAWAKDVLSHVHRLALLRWRKRKQPDWGHIKDHVEQGFALALANVPTMPDDTEFDQVTTFINAAIDDYIKGLMARAPGQLPKQPKRVDRGAKRRGPHPIKCNIAAYHLIERMRTKEDEFLSVLQITKSGNTRLAFSMAKAGEPKAAIKRETGFSMPRLNAEYDDALARLRKAS